MSEYYCKHCFKELSNEFSNLKADSYVICPFCLEETGCFSKEQIRILVLTNKNYSEVLLKPKSRVQIRRSEAANLPQRQLSMSFN